MLENVVDVRICEDAHLAYNSILAQAPDTTPTNSLIILQGEANANVLARTVSRIPRCSPARAGLVTPQSQSQSQTQTQFLPSLQFHSVRTIMRRRFPNQTPIAKKPELVVLAKLVDFRSMACHRVQFACARRCRGEISLGELALALATSRLID